jgi:cytochrome P450
VTPPTPAPAPAPGASSKQNGCPVGAVSMAGPYFRGEPHQLYRDIRRDHGAVAPVLLDGDIPAWLVVGYREVLQITADPALFSRDPDIWNQWDSIPDDWPLLPMFPHRQQCILNTVGERHRERAAMVSDALEVMEPFTIKQYAERYADELIDAFCTQGSTDIVGEYAMRLPVRVLARLFGFPDAQGPGIVAALNDIVDGGEPALAGLGYLAGMRSLLAERRAVPGQDVVSRMLRNTAGFSDEEVFQDMMVIVAAGHGSTADWIGNSLRLMLTDERFAASLSGGRHSVAEAMNEVLWEDTPNQNVAGRWATRDTRLGDRDIRAGDLLVLSLAGANYDPQVRTDGSALTGGNHAHLSFGHGEHRCPFPAQEIAEIIARAAIEVLLDRLPDLDLAVPADQLTRRPSPWLRGLSELPVVFTPTPALGTAG